MAKCKDCLHNEMCYATHTDDSPSCCEFKDRSRYVVREKGEWEYKDTCGVNTGKFHCSVCNKIPKSLNTEDFCPNCGADMRKGENDGSNLQNE